MTISKTQANNANVALRDIVKATFPAAKMTEELRVGVKLFRFRIMTMFGEFECVTFNDTYSNYFSFIGRFLDDTRYANVRACTQVSPFFNSFSGRITMTSKDSMDLVAEVAIALNAMIKA